jgi:hypothetical protein
MGVIKTMSEKYIYLAVGIAIGYFAVGRALSAVYSMAGKGS